MPQKRTECFRLLFDRLAWSEHQFLSGIRDSRKAQSLWWMMRDGGGVRKSIDQSWLAKELGLGLLCCSSNWVSGIFTRTIHQSQLHPCNRLFDQDVIKTVRHPPYSPDLAPCDFWLFPKLRGCRYETIEEMKEAVTKVIDTHTQEDFHGAF